MKTTGHWSRAVLVAITLGLLLAPTVFAQNPTGTLNGRITDQDGAGLPGVTITAASPSLQGSRVTTTGVNGDYKVAFLPPGDYQVTYELAGFKTSTQQVKISAANATLSNITMELGEVSEEIVVTAAQAAISETVTGASNITLDELENLPVQRSMASAINLAPGVANTGPSSAPSISGAMSFENLWLINGVVINENVRGSILPLFIEDAIQETTVAVSGISAEYGRFTGGVVNSITKSGGNEFEGSFRANLTNDDWISETELSGERVDDISETFEATLGGFLWKDHLWFFAAGRDRETSNTNSTDLTNITYPTSNSEERTEGKLTITPHPSHSVIGSYLEIEQVQTNTDFGTVLDLRSLNAQREDPQEIQSVNYTGILTSNLFLEAQLSEREFIIARGAGGVPDLIEGTLIRTRGEGFRYWSPTFCGSCEDQSRDNENQLVNLSYFLTTEGGGTHDLKVGYDTFEDSIFSINHQTGSDFTVYGSDVVRDAAGNIVLDSANGSPFPIFDPNASSTPWIRWFAIFNEDLAQPTSFQTNSFYVNDSWQLNDKWSFNVGVRYDENDGTNSAGATVANDDKISPRLGASYDMRGDGEWVFNASYGSYVAALVGTGSIGDGSSNGGAVGDYRFDYAGPAINTNCTPNVDCLTSPEVLREVFDWYQSQGGVFDLSQIDENAPIFDFLNRINIPGATTQVRGTLESPGAEELTFGVTKRLGSKGLLRADVVLREWEDFYGNNTTLANGTVPTSSGPADLTLIGNFGSDQLSRDYTGLHTQFRYRFTDRFTFAGNYSLSNTEGNVNGETTRSGPIPATIQSYPEYIQASWNFPDGDLRTDQRHKLRVWGSYDLINTGFHNLNGTVLLNYFSGQPYGANANIDPRPFVDNPGYQTPPTAVTYFFTDRDAFRTDDITRVDLALNYAFTFNAFGRGVELFLQPEVINVLDADGVIDPNGLDANEGITLLAPFDPFTETPVEGVNYRRNSNFGQPLNENDFQTPRTFRFSVGFRF
ncbi:MAG: TonB-dependent receptor [Acidobacteriota bacterium]